MYDMSIFTIEVLEFYNYSQLLNTREQLIKTKNINITLHKTAVKLGKVDEMIGFLKLIDILHENIKTVDKVLVKKEDNCFDYSSPIGELCLN